MQNTAKGCYDYLILLDKAASMPGLKLLDAHMPPPPLLMYELVIIMLIDSPDIIADKR